MKEKNKSIDILKFLAVLLITHSHMELLYGKFDILCTGGTIGDALFFFISGFTLFMGNDARFDNWYKRRINRIYPTVFAWAFLSSMLFDRHLDFVHTIMYGGGWFVTCIMIFYIIIYVVKKYCIRHLSIVFAGSLVIIVAFFFLLCNNKSGIYSSISNVWPLWCFSMMLFGAIMGLKSKSFIESRESLNIRKEACKLIGCVVCFYGVLICVSKFNYDNITIVALLPLYGIVYYLYRLCNCNNLLALYDRKTVHNIIYWCGSLCLEVYLVQYSLFTDRWNFLFPLNVLGFWIAIFAVAYLLKICGNFFSQTFKDQDYDWKKMISL